MAERRRRARAERACVGVADVAPTILHVMGLPKPGDMTGNVLLEE